MAAFATGRPCGSTTRPRTSMRSSDGEAGASAAGGVRFIAAPAWGLDAGRGGSGRQEPTATTPSEASAAAARIVVTVTLSWVRDRLRMRVADRAAAAAGAVPVVAAAMVERANAAGTAARAP